MSNETKRDVFKKLAECYAEVSDAYTYETGSPYYRENITTPWNIVYDAALPDDLPVIPKEVGEYIQWGKSYDIQLYMMYSFKFIHSQGFKKLTDDVESWIISSSNAFARAWLDGVWSVEETGEIVKLEAER
ncbi:hypothetical protein [Lacticaseibacillus paracasei]|uniref:hypothetical protein n=1 Tax=Lacticaseibacillus paracasei TaxID=1597 RepID=UPI004045D835